MSKLDAVVVGAGVAGSSAAVELLSAGCRVALLHQPDHISAIESISPAAVRCFEKLSISTGCVLPEIIAWWGSEREARAAQTQARIVQRRGLADLMRMRAMEAGATVIERERLLNIERLHDDWQIECTGTSDYQCRLTARFLVDATGRASLIGRRVGEDNRRHVQGRESHLPTGQLVYCFERRRRGHAAQP